MSVFHGLRQGNEVLKEIQKELNLESVEKLLEETAEAREYQRVSLRRHWTVDSYIYFIGSKRNACQHFNTG